MQKGPQVEGSDKEVQSKGEMVVVEGAAESETVPVGIVIDMLAKAAAKSVAAACKDAAPAPCPVQ